MFRVCRLTDIGVLSLRVRTYLEALYWARFLNTRWDERCWIEYADQPAVLIRQRSVVQG